jgi:hypothetical protein
MLSGFAFVTYDNEDTANTVIAMGTLDYNGVELKLSSAVRKVRVHEGSFLHTQSARHQHLRCMWLSAQSWT